MESTDSPATSAEETQADPVQQQQPTASPRLRFGALGLLFSALAVPAAAVALLTHVRPFSGVGLAMLIGCMPTGLLLSAWGAFKDHSRKAAVAGLLVTVLHLAALCLWGWTHFRGP